MTPDVRTVSVTDNCAVTHTELGPRVARGDNSECRIVRETLSQLGDKWTLLVILCLGNGPLRFNAVQRAVVGISHRMLTVTLRKLERDGLVQRIVDPTFPARAEYSLTQLGVSFTEPVMAVARWAIAAKPAIENHREQYDALAGAAEQRPETG
jgi:DNA-binding HxlR family transcriptional regulator